METNLSDDQELDSLYRFLLETQPDTFNDIVFWTEVTGDSNLFRDVFFGKKELPSSTQRITLLYNYMDESPAGGGMTQMEKYERWLSQQS